MDNPAPNVRTIYLMLLIAGTVLGLVGVIGYIEDPGPAPPTFTTTPSSINDIGVYPVTDTYSLDFRDGVAVTDQVTVVGRPVNVSGDEVLTRADVQVTGDYDQVRLEVSDGTGRFTQADRSVPVNATVTGPASVRPVVENLTGEYHGWNGHISKWYLSGEGINTRKGHLLNMIQYGLLILVASVLAFTGLRRWSQRRSNASSNASSVFLIAGLLVVMAGMGAAAPSVSADYPDDVLNAGVTEHTFTGLAQDATYSVVAIRQGGNTTLTTFTTDSNGAARDSFRVSPIAQNVKTDRDGFRYILRDSGGNTVMDIPAYYGPQLNELDVFSDGQISDAWVPTTGSFSETGGTPYGVLSGSGSTLGICLNSSVKIGAGDVVDVNMETTEGSDVLVKLHSSRSSCTSGSTSPHDSVTFSNSPASQDRFTVETEPGNDQATVSWAGNTGTVDLPNTGPVYIEVISNSGINHGLRFGNASIHPAQSDWFGSLSEGGEDEAHIFQGPGIYNWQNYRAVTTSGAAGFQWRTSENSAFTSFISDVSTSQVLEVVNTDSGRARFLAVDSSKFDLFTELAPADETSVTVPFQVFEFVPTENIRDIYGERVSVGIEYTNGTGGFTRLSGAFQSGCLGQNYIDFFGNGAFMDLSECIDNGEPVRFEGDISSVDGRITWRFFLNSSNGGFSTAPTVFSEKRELNRVVPTSNVVAQYPREGTVVEDATPEFTASFTAAEPGSLQLAVDGIVRKTWRFDDTTSGVREYEPSSALPIGQHSYRFTFIGDSGQSFQSDQISFTVDDEPDVNVSLLSPPDNLVTTNRTIDLEFNIERAYDVNASVYLNQRPVGSVSLDPGTSNETVTVSDLGINEYTWSVEVQNESTTVLSESRQFEVSENVTLNPVRPPDGATIGSAPVVFNVNVSSSAPGQLELVIDGELETATNVDAGFDGQKEIVLNRDALTSGKHTYSWRLTTDSGNEFVTESRTFTLLSPGVNDDCPTDGKILGIFDVSLEAGLGTNCGTNAIIAAGFIIAVIGGLVALASPILGGAVSLMLVLGFTAAGWLPALFTTAIVILAAAVVAKWGTSVFGGGG